MDLRIAAYVLLLVAPIGAAEPVEFSAEYTGDILAVISGGLSTGTNYLDNLDLELEIDLAEAWEAPGPRPVQQRHDFLRGPGRRPAGRQQYRYVRRLATVRILVRIR